MGIKMSHHNTIEKVSWTFLGDESSNIHHRCRPLYYWSWKRYLGSPKTFLLINLDEVGFGKSPDKSKCKREYVIKGCKAPPFWRGQTDPQHIYVVIAVTVTCTDIIPLFLLSRKRLDHDLNEGFKIINKLIKESKKEKGDIIKNLDEAIDKRFKKMDKHFTKMGQTLDKNFEKISTHQQFDKFSNE